MTRYNSGTGESVIWVNPQSEQSTSAGALDNPATGTVGAVALRQDSGIGDLTLGALKIGTSFSDVLTVVQPSPAPLNIARVGSDIVLSWTNAAFSLAGATDVTGPYTKIVGATSPYTNSPTGTSRFFRLVWP